MAYTPTQWNNGGPPGISAERLNKIEQGIKGAHDTADGAASAISTHAGRTDNPHSVTKSQVGLGNVQNYGIASQAAAEAGTQNNVYMTPLRTKQYVDTRLLNNLRFRMNNGVVEYNDGGGWTPMSNGVMVASSTTQIDEPTERTVSGNGSFMLVSKFVPKTTGELLVAFELRNTSAANSTRLYLARPFAETQQRYLHQSDVKNASPIDSIGSTALSFDYRTPVGTVVTPTDTIKGLSELSRTTSTSYNSFTALIYVYEAVPFYLLLYNENINGSAYVRNIKYMFDIIR